MAKFQRPKLNNWLLTLVLASIGLHGFVLALPMPDLVETSPEIEETADSEVIQVVTLPKLATVPEATDSPLLPPPQEPPPQEPAPVEQPVVDIVITNPEILEEIEPEFVEDDWDDSELEDEPSDPLEDEPNDDSVGDEEDRADEDGEDDPQTTLEQRIANRNSYQNFDGTKVGNNYASSELLSRYPDGDWPSPLHALAGTLPKIVVPLQDCLDDQPGNAITVVVDIGPDAQIVGGPETLNSTGYDVLDEQALEIAREADYAPHHEAGKTKEYMLEIDVDYQACSTASVLTNPQATS